MPAWEKSQNQRQERVDPEKILPFWDLIKISIFMLREPPTILRPSENHSEQEYIEIAVTKLLLRSYYDVARKNIKDAVPKSIMHFLSESR